MKVDNAKFEMEVPSDAKLSHTTEMEDFDVYELALPARPSLFLYVGYHPDVSQELREAPIVKGASTETRCLATAGRWDCLVESGAGPAVHAWAMVNTERDRALLEEIVGSLRFRK